MPPRCPVWGKDWAPDRRLRGTPKRRELGLNGLFDRVDVLIMANSQPNPDRFEGDADEAGPEFRGFRGSVIDPRTGLDRRQLAGRDGDTGLDRRRGPGRRRTDFTKAAEEGEMTKEQFLFLMAIDAFKQVNGKAFPAWTDVLEVIRLLGYRKTCSSELTLPNAEDWVERADASSGVRSKPGHPEAA